MSNFETWWEREGQEFLYALNTTTDDDIKLVAEVAWKNGAYCAEQVKQEDKDLVAQMNIDVGLKQKVYEALAEQAEQEDKYLVQSEVKSLRQQVAALKAVVDAWNNVEQEPVAWVDLEQWQSGEYDCFTSEKVADYMTPLYTAPVRKKDLTDEEIQNLRHKIDWTAQWSYVNFARAVIAADREKNK